MSQVRRSKRQRVAVDYARLDESGFDDSTRVQYKKLSRAVAKWPPPEESPPSAPKAAPKPAPKNVPSGNSEASGVGELEAPASVPVIEAKNLSEYVHSTGFRNPCVVRASEDGPAALGMRLPESELTVEDLAKHLGNDRQIQTIDVTTQAEGPVYTMEKWVSYFRSPNPKTPLLNVVSLDLANTPLQEMVSAPSLVKELDLVEKAWPRNQSTTIPEVQLYAIMSVQGCFMDFHLDFGGSSVWYHVISGKKSFLMIPPTKGNLMLFEEWSSSDKQASVFFAERASGGQKVDLCPGDTLLLPGGWPHCVVTNTDSVVIGGNFLTGYNLAMQLDVWMMEERLKVRQKFRFPFYKQLMWYTTSRYLRLLNGESGEEQISKWEKDGLPKLIKCLKIWLESKDGGDAPPDISDPAALLNDLENSLKKVNPEEPVVSPTGEDTGSVKAENEEEGGEEEEEEEDYEDQDEEEEEKYKKDDDEDFDVEKDGDATSSDTDEDFDESEDSEDSGSRRRGRKPAYSKPVYSKPTYSRGKKQTKAKALTYQKASPAKKGNSKANTTVRERLMKKIGIDPRMPFPNPKQRPKPPRRQPSPPDDDDDEDDDEDADEDEEY